MNTPDPIAAAEDEVAQAIDTTVALTAETAPELRELVPHPELLRVWILGAISFIGPIVLVALMISIFTNHWWIGVVPAIVGAGIIAITVLYGRAWLARFRCRLLGDGLWVDRGVWWRSETFVPRARVQHTEVQQGPIARRYGMASLKVFTAGASHGEIEIDGLIHADALWLRDELLGRHGRDTHGQDGV